MTGALLLVDGGISTAKGGIGRKVPRSLRKPPPGRLDLRHTHEGLQNKEAVQAKLNPLRQAVRTQRITRTAERPTRRR